MSISFTPMTTTGISNGFVVSTTGFVQGTFLDDPAIRYQLEGGVVASAQSTPLWGGVPVNLTVPAVSANATGPSLTASSATIDAWVIFNQAAAGIITPSSNVPLYTAGMSVNFMRVGCGARVVLPLKAADLATIAGGESVTALYWNTTNLYIQLASSGGIELPTTTQIEFVDNGSKTVSYSNPNATWTSAGSAIVVRI